jgi:hypothetical protein
MIVDSRKERGALVIELLRGGDASTWRSGSGRSRAGENVSGTGRLHLPL